MSKIYFGQGCPYFVGQWEFEEIEINDFKDKFSPILVLCSHPDNPEYDIEGSCNRVNCPLLEREEDFWRI